jgi:lipopolysaccharide assembly protein A
MSAREDDGVKGGEMRVFYLLILLILLAATAIFALQNQQAVTIRYLDRSVASPLSVLIGGVYFLGMLTGWTVIGVVRRSIRRISERPPQ